MARAVNKGEPVSEDAFDFQNDESWQARLDDARARREIALREKSGDPQPKKRLKPWEVENPSARPVEPIIQERDSDRVDFADRVDTMQKVTKKLDDAASAPRGHNWAPVVANTGPGIRLVEPSDPPLEPQIEALKPPAADDFEEILTTLAKPRTANLDEDSELVLADAPDVAELASRYAATLEPEVDTPATQDDFEEVVAPVVIENAPARKSRPVLMASAAMLLALVPLAHTVPPLETGPEVPFVTGFVFQPALGVTWSLQETPVPTRSGEWVPRTKLAPVAPVQAALASPAKVVTVVEQPMTPGFGTEPTGSVDWAAMAPVALAEGTRLYEPSVPPASGALPVDVINASSAIGSPIGPRSGPARLPEIDVAPYLPSVRPTPQGSNREEALAPAASVPDRPLKMTILRPVSSDKRIADTIAADISNRGHELVRIRDVNLSISGRNLRYFYEADRAEAGTLAEDYNAELRDFTWFRPRPAEGTAELWLAGKSGNKPVTSSKRQNTAALQPPAPKQVLIAPTAANEPRSLFERIFMSHKRSGNAGNARDGGGQRLVRQPAPAVGTTTSAVDDGPTVTVSSNDQDVATTTDRDTTTTTSTSTTDTTTSSGSGSTSDTTSGSDTTAGTNDGSTTSSSSGSDTSGSDTSSSDTSSSDTNDSSSSSGNNGNGKGNGNGGGKGNGGKNRN